MLKRNKKIIVIIFFILVELILLINPNLLINSVNESTNLFLNKLLISLFPFFILNDILIGYGLAEYLSLIKLNFITKLLKINNYSLSIIFLSMITGHPSNAKYIKDALDKKIISENEATKILTFTFFPSPVFVVTFVGYFIFNSLFIGLMLLLIIYMINFILALIIRNKIEIEQVKYIVNNKTKISFSNILKNSIANSSRTLIIIYGNIVLFTIITNLFSYYLNLGEINNTIFSCLLELTNGIKKIGTITNFNVKFSASIFILIFSGLSVHSQTASILSDYSNINYKFVIKYRILSAVISSIFVFFLLSLLF